jgi:hypothetical protein
VTERYFSLGQHADQTADHYLVPYYGAQYFNAVRADTSTTPAQLEAELHRLSDAGCDDVILLPCSDEPNQPVLLARALEDLGIGGEPGAGGGQSSPSALACAS